MNGPQFQHLQSSTVICFCATILELKGFTRFNTHVDAVRGRDVINMRTKKVRPFISLGALLLEIFSLALRSQFPGSSQNTFRKCVTFILLPDYLT